eukprot:170379-Pelagomonas_calceolata.AAC.4
MLSLGQTRPDPTHYHAQPGTLGRAWPVPPHYHAHTGTCSAMDAPLAQGPPSLQLPRAYRTGQGSAQARRPLLTCMAAAAAQAQGQEGAGWRWGW